MAIMASICTSRSPVMPSYNASSVSRSCAFTTPRSLSFSASALSGDKIISRNVTSSRQTKQTPLIVLPRAVSDSKNSQTCLEPDASRVNTTILGLDDKRAKEMPFIASMGIYIVSKNVMLDLLSKKFPDANDFGSEVIPGATSIGMRVQAYLYDGYWEDIGTIEAFYNANLGITKKPVPDFSFYDRSSPIYTQPRYLLPSKMLDADVTDRVIGEGCVIKNCRIHHSVVGLRSCISEGAIIEDTLLMGADYYEV